MTYTIPPSAANDEYLYLPVPKRHLAAVTRLLASLDAEEAEPMSPPAPAPLADSGWTDADLVRVAAGATETTRILTEIMDALAARPDEWLDLTGLAGITGRERNQLRHVWTHVTRHLSKHYPGLDSPVAFRWGTTFAPPRDAVAFYSLDPALAARWRRIRER